MRHIYMEDALDIPARDIMQIMQERIQVKTIYFGRPAVKGPIDFWFYHEVIFESKLSLAGILASRLIEAGRHS
jgi:hypothetical protein